MKKLLLSFLLLITSVILFACSGSESSDGEKISVNADSTDSYPTETLNVIIPFGAGGGTDLYIRKIMEIMESEDIYTKNIKIENREGGSGATGWGFFTNQTGNPYYVSPTSASLFTTPLVSEVDFSYESFTPIALMGADDLYFLVNANSKYETLDDFIAAAGEKKMKIGGVGQVSDEMIIPSLFAKEAGFEFDYVPFQSAGELATALLSDSLDAIVGNPARSLGQIEGGLMKPLAFSGLERIEHTPEVPTFIELGYEVNLSQPRGILLPGEVDEEVKKWWVDAMKQVSETEAWKKYLSDNGMSEYMLFGDEFTEFLNKTNETFKTSLEDTDK
ncbi:tripartite tricarboxylate transporter substrate binding protein [Lysinibacillus yapensis]|uniref:Tripartite tricarboxylate transporter substrate binding protein n=1 Tax=Ureibacillus yapensis TaxID=2304605 RepID=A0A396SL05_9BACL|nr:tripartite tricarboxylate transporter substrate binding protein [Lysinibacillus yapensis]RHW35898.1 tripartite tricarboxylate transporter substrate binding protein [Lysinibacillus yapensis]